MTYCRIVAQGNILEVTVAYVAFFCVPHMLSSSGMHESRHVVGQRKTPSLRARTLWESFTSPKQIVLGSDDIKHIQTLEIFRDCLVFDSVWAWLFH